MSDTFKRMWVFRIAARRDCKSLGIASRILAISDCASQIKDVPTIVGKTTNDANKRKCLLNRVRTSKIMACVTGRSYSGTSNALGGSVSGLLNPQVLPHFVYVCF